jgi:hypothetical protein
VVVSVIDTGPGIGPEERERLFEPFQQLDSSIRRKYGGSGLGLNISKHFVEMHEGRIWLESEPGQGSTFHVSLPVETPQYAAALSPGSRRSGSPFHGAIQRTRMRVAEIPHVGRRYVVLDQGSTLPRLLRRYANDVDRSGENACGGGCPAHRRPRRRRWWSTRRAGQRRDRWLRLPAHCPMTRLCLPVG